LTRGEQFVESLPRKVRFYDRNERRTYELTRAVAARLIDDPSLLDRGLVHARRHMGGDASQSQSFIIWQELLQRDVGDVVRGLLEDTPRGALLRDTQPVFCVLPNELRRKIIMQARPHTEVTID